MYTALKKLGQIKLSRQIESAEDQIAMHGFLLL